MALGCAGANVFGRKEEEMNAIGIVIVMAYVTGVLAVVAYVLFRLSPFAHHDDVYHNPGERQQSPHLD
jgi:hypothetical protein